MSVARLRCGRRSAVCDCFLVALDLVADVFVCGADASAPPLRIGKNGAVFLTVICDLKAER